MRIPIDYRDRIVKISESRGVDRNAVLKEAVAAYLQNDINEETLAAA
jgi:predicted DNA-binding protein